MATTPPTGGGKPPDQSKMNLSNPSSSQNLSQVVIETKNGIGVSQRKKQLGPKNLSSTKATENHLNQPAESSSQNTVKTSDEELDLSPMEEEQASTLQNQCLWLCIVEENINSSNGQGLKSDLQQPDKAELSTPNARWNVNQIAIGSTEILRLQEDSELINQEIEPNVLSKNPAALQMIEVGEGSPAVMGIEQTT